MPRGGYDYDIAPNPIGAVSIDTAELAARLGSANVIHRVGQVLLSDIFDHGLGEWNIATTSGALAGVRIDKGWKGGVCMKITPHTGSGVSVIAQRSLPLLDVSKTGYECMLSWEYSGASEPATTDLFILHYTGAYRIEYFIRVIPEEKIIQVAHWDGASVTWVTVGTFTGVLKSTSAYTLWNWIKLIVDLDRQVYDRYYINAQSVDVSDYSPKIEADTQSSHLWVGVRLQGVAAPYPVNVDGVVVTIGEP
jgi:hypothetical protein